jgi:hypothetical protein
LKRDAGNALVPSAGAEDVDDDQLPFQVTAAIVPNQDDPLAQKEQADDVGDDGMDCGALMRTVALLANVTQDPHIGVRNNKRRRLGWTLIEARRFLFIFYFLAIVQQPWWHDGIIVLYAPAKLDAYHIPQ